MNTALDQPVMTTVIACPAWCATRAKNHEHATMEDPDGVRVVHHMGPQWGEYVWAFLVSDAVTGNPIRVETWVSDLMDKQLTAGNLRALAADCLAAAEWIEARA